MCECSFHCYQCVFFILRVFFLLLNIYIYNYARCWCGATELFSVLNWNKLWHSNHLPLLFLSTTLSCHYLFLATTSFLPLPLSYHYLFLATTSFLPLPLSYHYLFLATTSFLPLPLSLLCHSWPIAPHHVVPMIALA